MQEEIPQEQIILAWKITPTFPLEVKQALQATGKRVYFPSKWDLLFGTYLTVEEVLDVIRPFYPRAQITYSLYHREYGNITLRPRTFMETILGAP